MSALEKVSAQIFISLNLLSLLQMKVQREFHKMYQKQLIQRESQRELLSEIKTLQGVYTLKNLLMNSLSPLQINQLNLHLNQRQQMLNCYCAITIATDISLFDV